MNLQKWFKRFAVLLLSLLVMAGICGVVLWRLLLPPELDVPLRTELVLGRVHIVNPGAGRLEAQTLTTSESRIISIAPSSETEPGGGAYDGMYILPGLVDMHVHFPPRTVVGNQELWAIMFLAYGVTTVRDMGSADGSIFKFREQVRNGALPGPRIFAAGPVLDGSPAAFPSNRVVTTPEEARQAVDEAAAQGADFIKAYHMLSPECIAAIKVQAVTHGLRVVGHVPLTTPVESGLIEDVQHLTGIPVSSDLEDLLDDRAEWSLEDALKIDDARIDALAEAFLKNNTAYTPTMINPRMRRKQGGRVADSQDDAIEILPTLWKDTWGFIFGTTFTPGTAGEKDFEQQRKKYKEVTFKLYRAGVEIHAGTDTMMPYVVPGKSLHGELEELVDAGLSTEEAFTVATSVAGAWLADDGLGQVVAGGPADFLIFSADPTENMENLDTLAAVVADGRLYTRAYLDQSIEAYRDHFHGNLYESVMGLPLKLVQEFYAPD